MQSTTSPELASLLAHLRMEGKVYDREKVDRAYRLAREVYGTRAHESGVPLLTHAIGTLEVLTPFQPDEDAIVATLLHHVLDQGGITLLELEEQYGSSVRTLVSGLHLLSHITLRARRSRIEDLRLMLLSVSEDVRTVLIALCDRAHILRYLHEFPLEERKQLCQDVLQLFAPVAARLGIYALKHDLENHAFPVMYPSDAERIQEQLLQFQAEKGEFLSDSAKELERFFLSHGIVAEIEARRKEPYSIFTKMQQKAVTHIADLFDFYALRVIVGSEAECYQVLGLLHQVGRPVGQRFKDYIAFPKPNGYQSLHTTLLQLPRTPPNTFVEVQVRTHGMHREAQYGVAAHWSYKEGGATVHAVGQIELTRMLVSQESLASGTTSLYVDHIYVLTPKGTIVELPEGATPLDFAFQVHTDLGLSFNSARVNGSIVPLDYRLENGDVVEIQKRSPPQPSPQWLQLLKMASSRSKLKRYLNVQDRPRFVALGRDFLNEELRTRHLPVLDTDLSILRVCDSEVLTVLQREDLLMKIGQGAEKASSLLHRLKALQGYPEALPQPRPRRGVHRQGKGIIVEGGMPMPTRLAKCCGPDPKEQSSISGVINRLGVVMVHRSRCHMYQQSNPERRVGVKWG